MAVKLDPAFGSGSKGNENIELATVSPVESATVAGQNIPSGPATPRDEPEFYERPVSSAGNTATTTHSEIDISSILSEVPRDLRRRRELISYCPLLWVMFMQGWNDGTHGPLLPTMQKYYKIGYTVVSIIFVLNCVGSVFGALANVKMVDKFGFGTTMAIGAGLQAIGYLIEAPAPPFPLFAIAYIFSGFGLSLQSAGAISFVVNLKNSSNKMGLLLASYGVGALLSPLVATRFSTMTHWSYHYFASFGGAVVSLIAVCLAFRFQRMDVILRQSGQVIREHNSTSNGGLYEEIFKQKAVHVLAFFALAYVGTEVSIGGWIVTFLIDERSGGPSSGYVSSGFFGGLAAGRLALIWINKLVGERRVVFIYIVLCIALEITIWFVPSLVGNAIAVAFVGFLLGPIYPIISNVAGRLVPYSVLNGAVGWIGGLGQMGSALLPFVTGMMFSKFGVKSLQPLVVAGMGLMMGLWAIVPPDVRRSE